MKRSMLQILEVVKSDLHRAFKSVHNLISLTYHNSILQVLDKENNELVDNLTKRIDDLDSELAKLNKMLCGGSSEDCGGCTTSGCETCGGSSTDVESKCSGAKNLAGEALKIAEEAKSKLLKKKGK